MSDAIIAKHRSDRSMAPHTYKPRSPQGRNALKGLLATSEHFEHVDADDSAGILGKYLTKRQKKGT